MNKAAELAIPKTKNKQKNLKVPYWSDKCEDAIKIRKKALQTAGKLKPSTVLLITKNIRLKHKKLLELNKKHIGKTTVIL